MDKQEFLQRTAFMCEAGPALVEEGRSLDPEYFEILDLTGLGEEQSIVMALTALTISLKAQLEEAKAA